MIETLDRRAMLAHLGISAWSARKYDRKVSDEVTTAKQANAQAARVNKHLFGGPAKAHQDVMSLAGKARETHYRLTLPWGDSGWRLLPVRTYLEYRAEMEKLKNEFEEAVGRFAVAYPDLRKEAQYKMGDLFKETDYPVTVDGKFAMSSSFMPVPVAGDFRVDLAADVVHQVQEETREGMKDLYKAAMEDVWSRLRDVVEKATAKLAEPDAIFRDSLIENIKATAELAHKLNLDDDPNLKWAADRAKYLADTNPDILRAHKGFRKDTVQQMEELVSRMKGVW